MTEPFAALLAEGGKANSLGRVPDVIEIVLDDPSRIEELYQCLFDDNAWLRMRAADALEKICRQRPDWLQPYIDRFANELATSTQPSIQWHLAQIYAEVALTDEQKRCAIHWLTRLVHTTDVDWIVSANTLATLMKFTKAGDFPQADMAQLLKIQQGHASQSVVRKATKLLDELAAR